MKNLLNKYFPLKFVTKISHYYETYYCIRYSQYRFIPIYHKLKYFYFISVDYDHYEWMTKLFKYENVELMADKLKTIDDIKLFHENEKIREQHYKKSRKEYLKNSIPYKTKIYSHEV